MTVYDLVKLLAEPLVDIYNPNEQADYSATILGKWRLGVDLSEQHTLNYFGDYEVDNIQACDNIIEIILKESD